VEKCDVAIIGGGIAGLSAGKFLAERGVSFILLEEHREFFKKACGEGIIRNTVGYEFHDLYGSKRGIEREIWETIIHTKYGELSIEMPVLMTSKREVEAELARQAAAQGEIRMGERVEKIVDGVLLPQEIKPKIIIGADGCFSLVRRYMGERPVRCGIAAEGYATEVDMDPDRCHVVLKNEVVRYGYAWYFPKREVWNIGIGCSKKRTFRETFSRFREKNKGEGWRGAPVPIDKPGRSYRKNAILVGDAAAHVVANVGEGIMPSMIGAYIAAEVIERLARKDFREVDLSPYERGWKNTFGKYLRRTYYTSRIFYDVIKSEYVRHKLLAKMCRDTTEYYRKILKR